MKNVNKAYCYCLTNGAQVVYLHAPPELNTEGRGGGDHMIVGFITTYAISACHH